MIDIYFVFYILFAHWVADFIIQSDYVAQNKSKSNLVLLQHVSIYGVTLLLFTMNPLWAFINAVLHFMVDYVTSRLTSRLWREERVHDFFVVIGQLLHTTILIGTAYYLF